METAADVERMEFRRPGIDMTSLGWDDGVGQLCEL